MHTDENIFQKVKITPDSKNWHCFFFALSFQELRCLRCDVRFLWDSPTHYRGPIWLAYVAFIEGNFPQCGPQYIAVFGRTIPLIYSTNNVGTPHAFPKSFPSIYPANNMGFPIQNPLLYAYPNLL